MLPLGSLGVKLGLASGCVFLLCAAQGAAAGHRQQSPAVQTVVYSAPLELINDKPYVTLLVNGRGPYRFLVDTGTGAQALVSLELARELALPVVGHARLTDPTGQGNQRSDIVLMQSVKFGGLEFKDVKAVRHRLFAVEGNCQGILGFTLFKDYLFTLDFPGRHLILATGSGLQENGGSLFSFRMPDGVPLAAIRIDGQHFEALIDSGGTGLSLPEQLIGQVKFLSTPIEFGIGESLATRFSIKAARLRPDVRLGRYAFRQAFVEINSAFPTVNVGSTPLKNFIVTFDQSKLLMRIYASQKTMHLDASPSTMQLLNEPRREVADHRLVPVG